MITRRHFATSTEYHSFIAPHATDPNQYGSHGKMFIRDRESKTLIQTGLDYLYNGNPNTDSLNALINEFSFELEVPTKQVRASVRGHRVNMGAYLAGSPLNMYRRIEESSDHSPIRIYIGTSSSWGISPEQVNRRGAALAAFALALSQRRQVYLTPYVQLGAGYKNPNSGALISCDLQSSPLYLNELAAHFNANVSRFVGITACYKLCGAADGSWLPDYANEAKMRAHLGCKPDDIYLGSIHINDPLLTDPVGWIKTNLSKYLGNGDDSTD